MLLLFDIDGTLVSGAAREHAEALNVALREVHHVDPSTATVRVSPAGRTDGEIARATLLGCGVSAERIDELADSVREACSRIYARMTTTDLSHTVLAGIPELLDWLSKRDDAKLGLLTGNYEAVARMKLARAGISRFFASSPGAYGSDSEDRAALPAIARRRAGKPAVPYPRERTVVIGDTPRDIACAHADGVRCIAVATGPYRVDQLSSADAVAHDALELRARMSELLTG